MYKLLIVSLVFVGSLFAAEESDVVETVPQKAYINVSDVSSSSAELLTELKLASKNIEPQEEIVKISENLKVYIQEIDKELNRQENKYLEYISAKFLEEKEQNWQTYISQLTKWNLSLEDRTKIFDKKKDRLEVVSELWKETLKNAKKEKAPKLVVDNISNVIESIKKVEENAKKRYDGILTDLTLINKKILELNDILERTLVAKKSVSSNMFHKNTLSLSILWSEKDLETAEYIENFFLNIKSQLYGLKDFYEQNQKRLFIFSLYSVFISFFVLTFTYLYKNKRLFVHTSSYKNKNYFFILQPIATLVVLLAFINYFMFTDMPSSFKQIQLLGITSIPLFFIFKRTVPKQYSNYFYTFISLYALFLFKKYADGSEIDARLLSLFLTLYFIGYVVFIIKNSVLELFFRPKIAKFMNKILSVVILFLVISLLSNVYGATLLADYIINGLFVILYAALILYVLTMILTAYIIIMLRRRIDSVSGEIKRFAKNVEKSTTFLIKFFMFLWFLKVLLDELGVWEYVLLVKNSVIGLAWQVGEVTISVESMFNFIMILAGTWFLLKLINIVLEVEIFARFRFPRGVPTAISTTLNYLLTITGVIVALSSLGITIDQFALIFGALGVGIGFGLRNIIANFVSGIIMVFERPIQIGDTIAINNTMGTVQSIKTRSSIIKTFDGSEVIIPNADFIAKEITNWTLSDERRRKTLTFKVGIESDIDKVLEIMNSVVAAHPNVLSDPEPIATFLGFSEYYLEFKLYFWLHENILVAQSDVAVNIYKTLKENNIKMPVPKHDISRTRTQV